MSRRDDFVRMPIHSEQESSGAPEHRRWRQLRLTPTGELRAPLALPRGAQLNISTCKRTESAAPISVVYDSSLLLVSSVASIPIASSSTLLAYDYAGLAVEALPSPYPRYRPQAYG